MQVWRSQAISCFFHLKKSENVTYVVRDMNIIDVHPLDATILFVSNVINLWKGIM